MEVVYIEEYSPELQHIKGTHNVVADALSPLDKLETPMDDTQESFLGLLECFGAKKTSCNSGIVQTAAVAQGNTRCNCTGSTHNRESSFVLFAQLNEHNRTDQMSYCFLELQHVKDTHNVVAVMPYKPA
jgi:hypothetical protein